MRTELILLLKTTKARWLFVLVFLLSANIYADSPEAWDDQYDHYFQKFTSRYFGPHFDWRWFKAQAIIESSMNTQAKSPSGARGLMQLMPRTYLEVKSEQFYLGGIERPEWNIAAGIYYNRYLYRRWQGVTHRDRLLLSLASYNAGYVRVLRAVRKVKGKIKNWESIKQFVPKETQLYVARIQRLMNVDSAPVVTIASLSSQ